MSQIDTVRPTSVLFQGAATSVPSGTLAAVSSDNSDATYISFPAATNPNDTWSLRVGSHTPSAGYGRHAVRGRIRVRTDTGTVTESLDLGRGDVTVRQFEDVSVTSAFQTLNGSWYSDPGFGLATSGALTDLCIGGGYPQNQAGGITELRTAECYVDIDCRLQPQFAPEVRDNAGVDQAGATITDTTQPTLYFGAVAYDDLPPLDWYATITDDANVEVFTTSGSGTPPTSVGVTSSLVNGDYYVTFMARSTIRGADPFPAGWSLPFTLDNEVPPPSPPLLVVTPAFGGYQVSWSNPGGQQWDETMPLVAEVWRDDCTGSQRIATVPDGLNGGYLDLAIPQIDRRPGCEPAGLDCDITYRVRYWGYVSDTVEIPDVLPADLILAWPNDIGGVPDGWTRVTSLDGYYPRGAVGAGAPSATGGAASHSHTTPSHRHVIGPHSHALDGNTGGSSDSTQTNRFNGADRPTANQSHNHALSDRTGSTVAYSSGFTAAGTNTVANDPPTHEVVWIRSDGTETAYPIGVLAFSLENVSGWTPDATSAGRFLKGAPAISGGGAVYGSATHHHTVASHSHTVGGHDHTIDNTGLSGPQATGEAEQGGNSGANPRWVPRHTHLMNVVPRANTNTVATTGGNTSESPREPRHRRLRVLRNTGGGAQTRVIGLYTGALADLDPILTPCDGRLGTPDMRGLFAREMGSAGALNTIAGQDTHNHTTPNHTHPMLPHSHTTQVGAATGSSYTRKTSGDQGAVPQQAHDHTSPNTSNSIETIGSAGAGTTNTVSLVPPYREVHFVRVDGVVAGGPLPVPELKVTDFAEMTVPPLEHADGLDRLSNLTERIAVVTDRSSGFPRLVTDSTPIDGGLHTVSNTLAGEDMALTIAVEGMPAIDALEALLAADQVYWSPLAGTPGWFAPQGWAVSAPVRNVWVLTVTMARMPWPATADPEDFL